MPKKKTTVHEGPHKYKRIAWRSPIYKCVLPGCSHYLPEAHIEGAVSICWRGKKGCDGTVVMSSKTIGLVKPHCAPCTRDYVRADQEARVKIEEVRDRLDDLISGLDLET